MKFYWLVTEKTQVTDGRKEGRTEGQTDGRKDGRTDNAISISPSLFHRRGIIISLPQTTPITQNSQTNVNKKGWEDTFIIGSIRYTINTKRNRYVSLRSSCCTDTSGSIISRLTFTQLSKRLKHIEFDLNYVELIFCK